MLQDQLHSKDRQYQEILRNAKLQHSEAVERLRQSFEERAREIEKRYSDRYVTLRYLIQHACPYSNVILSSITAIICTIHTRLSKKRCQRLRVFTHNHTTLYFFDINAVKVQRSAKKMSLGCVTRSLRPEATSTLTSTLFKYRDWLKTVPRLRDSPPKSRGESRNLGKADLCTYKGITSCINHIRGELHLRLKSEVSDTEERKNAQIDSIRKKNERALTDMKNYYNDITLNNLAMISTLKEEIKTKEDRLERNEQLLSSVQQVRDGITPGNSAEIVLLLLSISNIYNLFSIFCPTHLELIEAFKYCEHISNDSTGE